MSFFAYRLNDITRDPALRLLIANKCYAYHLSQNDDNGAYEESIKVQLKEVDSKLANIMKALEAGIFNDTTAERIPASWATTLRASPWTPTHT